MDVELDFISRIQAAPSAREAGLILSGALEQFGYGRFFYGLAPRADAVAESAPIGICTFSDDWQELYFGNGLYRTHFDLRLAWQADAGARAWSAIFEMAVQGNMPQPFAKTTCLLHEAGWGEGVSMPLRQVGPFVAGIGLAADSAIPVMEHDRHFLAHRARIVFLIESFHACLDLRRIAVDFYRLTRREIEVLKWLADGYREQVIAFKLGTSVHTVQKQIASARRRLKAATAAQAVAKATALGVLTN